MSCALSTSTQRSAGPCPSVTTTTRQPWASQPRTSFSACSVSPRYGSGSRPDTTRDSASSAMSSMNGVTDHQGMPMVSASLRISARVLYAAAPRSIGTDPPTAALDHDASRNSWLVRTSSIDRVRTRSGSHTTTWAPAGSSSSSRVSWSTSTGASASMPSTGMPSEMRSSMSVRPGKSVISALARARTSSVSSSSRHGGAHSPLSATSSERWSATLK